MNAYAKVELTLRPWSRAGARVQARGRSGAQASWGERALPRSRSWMGLRLRSWMGPRLRSWLRAAWSEQARSKSESTCT